MKGRGTRQILLWSDPIVQIAAAAAAVAVGVGGRGLSDTTTEESAKQRR